jgi:outer membrane lipoprotein carrier protein
MGIYKQAHLSYGYIFAPASLKRSALIMIKHIRIGCIIAVVISCILCRIPVANAAAPDLEKIIDGIEKRYAGKGFSATFFQESTLKALQITDTAEGRLMVKHPGKMRWEYIRPDEQTVITDGQSMWIYRPADQQVMVGKAPDFLGAGFLSDIRKIRASFSIALVPSDNDDYYRLKLVPNNPTPELADIILSVSKKDFQVDQVVTHNTYGDETRIVLDDYRFDLQLDDQLFHFEIPEGVDVVPLDQL